MAGGAAPGLRRLRSDSANGAPARSLDAGLDRSTQERAQALECLRAVAVPTLAAVSTSGAAPAVCEGFYICNFLETMSMRINEIAVGRDPPNDVNVIVEVPIGGEPIKYELDKAAGTLVVDRFLYTSMRYPGNYGFIPHTLSGDGDPCDVLICNTRAIVPGAVISVRPVGVLLMEDNMGMDEKIIAVPSSHLTMRYDKCLNYSDLPSITLQQIEHFFEHYKDLEPKKWAKIIGWGDAAKAKQMILDGVQKHRDAAIA
jgi:inorganic pyrophosphatase